MRVTLRVATPDDATEIRRVMLLSVRKLSRPFFRPRIRHAIDSYYAKRTARKIQGMINRSLCTVVAVSGREIVGVGQLRKGRHDTSGHIRLLYVRPPYHGHGIGSAVLERLERSARARGIHSLSLESTLNALGFYAKRGYVDCGVDPHDCTAHIMRKQWLRWLPGRKRRGTCLKCREPR